MALVPRVLWPDKPVYGAAVHIVADMTGLHLDENTSWGVGNVMEFQINFGTTGVIIGFLILGFSLGWLDFRRCGGRRPRRRGQAHFVFSRRGRRLSSRTVRSSKSPGARRQRLVPAYMWKWAWDLWLHRSKQRTAVESSPHCDESRSGREELVAELRRPGIFRVSSGSCFG